MRAGVIIAAVSALLAWAAAATPARAATQTQCGATPATSALDPNGFTDAWKRSGPGWTGGDGARSVLLPDGRVLWAFGDTFLGSVRPDGSRAADSPLVHNTIAIQDGDCLETHFGGTAAAPRDLVTPATSGHWFWSGDPIVDGRTVEIVMTEWALGPGGDWQHVGDSLARFSLPDLELQSVVALPGPTDVMWGEHVLVDGAWTYVYGLRSADPFQRYLHVARVPTGQLGQPSSWRFWTGSGWSADPPDSTSILTGVADADVIPTGDGYVLLAQQQGYFPSLEIYAYRSSSPVGPWSAPDLLTTIPTPEAGVFTYGAMPHPEFTDGDSLLIGYSVNSFGAGAVYANAGEYRPRFLAIPFPRDADAPRITADATTGAGAYRAFEWTRGPVTVSFHCSAANGATVVSLTPPQTLSDDGSGQVVEGRCADSAGRASTARFGPVRIDSASPSAPNVSVGGAPELAAGADGGWYRDGVTVSFSPPAAADPAPPDGTLASGVAAGSIPSPQTLSTSGRHVVEGSVSDRAGNRSASAALTLNVDADPPHVTMACPARVSAGHRAVATWTASDAESGLTSAAGGAVALDTRHAGPQTAQSPPAADRVGHVAQAGCAYAVVPDTRGPAIAVRGGSARANRDYVVAVRVRCPAGEPAGCRGSLVLQAASAKTGAKRYVLRAGVTRPVHVRLTAPLRRRLASSGRLQARARARARDQAGNWRAAASPLELLAPRRAR